MILALKPAHPGASLGASEDGWMGVWTSRVCSCARMIDRVSVSGHLCRHELGSVGQHMGHGCLHSLSTTRDCILAGERGIPFLQGAAETWTVWNGHFTVGEKDTGASRAHSLAGKLHLLGLALGPQGGVEELLGRG